MTDIHEQAKGRWSGIFSALGIAVGDGGKHCSCPVCGPGSKGRRFRMDDREGSGSWICNHCGAGTGVDLVMKVLSVDFKGAVDAVRGVLGTAAITPPPKEKTVSRGLLRKIYTESVPVKAGDVVSRYLKNRGISVVSDRLRYHQACYEPETKTNVPAMLATFMMPEGKAITIHRTFLTPDGKKIRIKSPKKIMPSLDKMTGGAVRLFEPEDGVIGLAEGIETALAAHEISGLPVWSAVSSTLMEGFIPPKGIKAVFIFSDRDKSYAGQRAAFVLANKLVINHKIEANVQMPDRYGDFLDQLVLQNRKEM